MPGTQVGVDWHHIVINLVNVSLIAVPVSQEARNVNLYAQGQVLLRCKIASELT